jgi:hypothetical protein
MADDAPSVNEQLAALRLELSTLQAAQQQTADTTLLRKGAKVIPVAQVAARQNVPVWRELADLPHCADNPIQRNRAAPTTVGELDLKLDRGFVAASSGGSKAAEFEFISWGSLHSYLHDSVNALELQLAKPELDRGSLLVVLTHLQQINDAANTRLDFLRMRGEHLHTKPGLVAAVEEGIRGTAGYAITSPDILSLLGKYHDYTAKQAIKGGSAQQHNSPRGSNFPSRGGRGGGPRGRDGGGRNSQEREPRPSHTYNLRGAASSSQDHRGAS